ncbi:calcium-binding protein CML24-like [Eucalyptus grandis]|uniref:calcium-binding protein CML24-like n=1 Tax=Eucalyptus grandis TaxID=71139 RepID=UPI00192EC2FB|nr:calcium-binding protein CML24-like [Eucalyptus grandis]
METGKSASLTTAGKAAGGLGNVDQVRQVFAQYNISCNELREVLYVLGSSPTTCEEARVAMSEIDKDGDGFINLDEFAELILGGGDRGPECRAKELKDAFDLYDLEGNGVILASEFPAVLKKLGQKCNRRYCRKMISLVDRDGDSNVNFKEFKKMMTMASNGALS